MKSNSLRHTQARHLRYERTCLVLVSVLTDIVSDVAPSHTTPVCQVSKVGDRDLEHERMHSRMAYSQR